MTKKDVYTSIDFETATRHSYSACAVGLVSVQNGEIIDEYYTLIQPPNNIYEYFNTKVHGIMPKDTADAPFFPEVFQELKKRLVLGKIVAHNERFDRHVLASTMNFYEITDYEIQLKYPWECTAKIYRAKNEGSAGLAACSKRYDIVLDHHNALSDARACAILYHKHKNPLFDLKLK